MQKVFLTLGDYSRAQSVLNYAKTNFSTFSTEWFASFISTSVKEGPLDLVHSIRDSVKKSDIKREIQYFNSLIYAFACMDIVLLI